MLDKQKQSGQKNSKDKTTNKMFHNLKSLLLKLSFFKSLLVKPISLIPAVIVGVLIGLAPIWYGNFLNSPELKGRIINVATGFQSETASVYAGHTTFTVFMAIANQRKTPVSVIDYQLIITYSDNTERTYAPIYDHSDSTTLSFDFGTLTLQNNQDYLLNKASTLITLDKPLMGFLYFDGNFDKNHYKKLQVVLIDAFGNRYIVDTPTSDYRPIPALSFIFKNIKFKFKKQ